MDSTKAPAGETLRAGEAVYHPRCGFGVVRGVLDQGLGHLMAEYGDGLTGAYYEIETIKEGRLFAPVARATAVGLRRLSDSLATVLRCLVSDAVVLPEISRERAGWLHQREQAHGPDALPEAVRDLIAVRNRSRLSNSERKWLDQACRRLSAEAARWTTSPSPKRTPRFSRPRLARAIHETHSQEIVLCPTPRDYSASEEPRKHTVGALSAEIAERERATAAQAREPSRSRPVAPCRG